MLVEEAEILGQREDEIAAEPVHLPAASMADILNAPALHQTTPSIADSSIWDSCASGPKPNHEVAHSFAAGTSSSTDRSGGGLPTISDDAVPAHAFDTSRLPTAVILPTYSPNPAIRQRISRDMVSPQMQRFLDNCHKVPAGDTYVWEYNDKGWSPIHSLMDCCKAVALPAWERDRMFGLSTQQQYDWLYGLFTEGVDVTVTMYGECTVRTQGTQPPNNTPLMMLSKAKPQLVDQLTYVNMIEYLLKVGKGGLSLVDNHGMNALMLASGGGNYAFIKWAYDRKERLADDGFNWEATNDAGRNMLCLCRQQNSNLKVVKALESLAAARYITILDHPPVAGEPGRQGGQSNVHRRHRRQGVQEAVDESQWVSVEDGEEYQWCISE